MEKKDYIISLKLMRNLVISVLICMLCYATVESISMVLFTNTKGVYINTTDDKGNVSQEIYYLKENETTNDIKLKENQSLGGEISTERKPAITIMSGVIEQLVLFWILYLANTVAIREYSRKHRYAHTLNGKPFDKYRGLKLGLLASIPFFIVYLLLVIGKATDCNALFKIYRALSWQTMPMMKLFCFGNPSSISVIGWGSVALCSLCWAVLPLVSQVVFLIGADDGNLYNKIVYKK